METTKDIIYIEESSGAINWVGISDAFSMKFELEAQECVPLPKGEFYKKKEIV